jgi:hypothetical protein
MKSGWIRDASVLLAAALLIAGCGGGSKFKNEARPPVPVELTGVITDRGVTISPNRVGAGPVILRISNQTNLAHTITLEGNGTRDTVGPVNPLSAAPLQQTVKQGTYTVKVGSKQASARDIPSGTLIVTRERQNSSNTLLLP